MSTKIKYGDFNEAFLLAQKILSRPDIVKDFDVADAIMDAYYEGVNDGIECLSMRLQDRNK